MHTKKKPNAKPPAKKSDKAFKLSLRTIYDVPLNSIVANPGNPGGWREREVIPSLYKQGYRIFPAEGIPDDHCLWTMLNGKPGKPPVQALRDQAVTLIAEFEGSVIEMSESIENTMLIHPVHLVVQKGKVGIESGMVRAFAKAFKDAAMKRLPSTIEGEVDKNPDEKLMLARAAVENIHFIPHQTIALAQRYASLRTSGMSIEEIAKRVGRSVMTVRNYLDLADHPPDVQEQIASGDMTMQEALEMNREAREKNVPLEQVVDEWRKEAAGDVSGLPHTLIPGSGRRNRTKKKSMLKWDKAFLILISISQETPKKADLEKLDKDALVTRVLQEHAAAEDAMRKVLQINEDEAVELIMGKQLEDIGDFGFGEDEE